MGTYAQKRRGFAAGRERKTFVLALFPNAKCKKTGPHEYTVFVGGYRLSTSGSPYGAWAVGYNKMDRWGKDFVERIKQAHPPMDD